MAGGGGVVGSGDADGDGDGEGEGEGEGDALGSPEGAPDGEADGAADGSVAATGPADATRTVSQSDAETRTAIRRRGSWRRSRTVSGMVSCIGETRSVPDPVP